MDVAFALEKLGRFPRLSTPRRLELRLEGGATFLPTFLSLAASSLAPLPSFHQLHQLHHLARGTSLYSLTGFYDLDEMELSGDSFF